MSYPISVVMPALDEEGNIARAVGNAAEAFRRLGIQGEILVVNDGSTDRTGALVEEMKAQYPFLRLLRHEKPQGIGRSFWDGIQAAQGDVVTMLPGDAENDAYEILRYLPLLDHVDVVIPFVFNQECRSLARRLVSSLYRRSVNLAFGTSLNYMNGTVLYRREVLKQFNLSSNGFFYQTELLVKCLRAGYLYAEVPYGLKKRQGGGSTALTLRSLKKVIADFLRTFVSVKTAQPLPLVGTSLSSRRVQEFKVTPEQAAPAQAAGDLAFT